MSPAPANESATLLSPFFSASTTAAPLSERECNGIMLCPSVSKGAPTSTACAMRRGASFLDADDACLACSDKTSFLIPEDSYLPGQENYTSAPCAPGTLPPLGRSHCVPYPSAGVICSSLLSPVHVVVSGSGHVASRPRMSTPFMLLDAPVFGSEEEFVAASVCFEKAVEALEMVELPSVMHNASAASRQASNSCGACPAEPAGAMIDGAAAAPADVTPGSKSDLQGHRQTSDLSGPRRVSSLSSSPGVSIGGGAGEQPFPAMPYEQAATSAHEQDCADGADSGIPGSWHQASPTAQAQERIGVPSADMVAAAVTPAGTEAAAAMVASAAYLGAAGDVSPVFFDSAVPVAPAAPPPAPRTFHHKTGGPCDHCGATESPQWRRGPPAKPMLCNACGTRFRRTNQLNPAAALSPAGRAAAAAAAAAAVPAAKRNAAAKRDPPYIASTSAKRGRSSAGY